MSIEIKFAIESEKTLLGGLLLDSYQFVAIKDKLSPDDFYYLPHISIFRTMNELHEKHNNFDIPMICNDHPELETYLLELTDNCCSVANLNSHADIIREKSVQRTLQECAKELKESKE